MKIIFILLFLILNISTKIYAIDNNEIKRLENILKITSSMGDHFSIDFPLSQKEADDILYIAVWSIYFSHDKIFIKDNEKRESGNFKIRKSSVDKIICDYFGIDAKNEPLLSGADKYDFDGEFFYVLGDGIDWCEIERLKVLENDTLRVRAFCGDARMEMIALFKKIECGGTNQWRFVKYDYKMKK